MIRDLLTYLALAVWCNTAAGPPFDPVLLWYAARHPFPAAWIFIGLGGLCAGAGAAAEAGLVRAGTAGLPRPRAGRRFYVMAFLVAASPVPFTLVRAAAIGHRPRAWPYALAVAAGRLPRYVATVSLWAALAPPTWLAAVGFTAGLVPLAVAAARRWRRPSRPLPATRDTVTAS